MPENNERNLTRLQTVPAKTIISGYTAENSWFGVNYNMNIYRGCNHGCIYCDSRSECYGIEVFDEIRAKENALFIIERDLKSKQKKGVVATGAMSDPYNQYERTEKLSRGALELIDKYRFGGAIVTKSTLITRDIDLMQQIAYHSPVLAKLTITSADDGLARLVEPNAPSSSERFKAVKELSSAKIPVCVLLMPVLPFILDNEKNLREIVELSAENGAKYIYAAMGMTLRQNQKTWYLNELDKKFPGIRKKYEYYYTPNSYEHHSLRAEELWEFFNNECQKHGIITDMKKIIASYKSDYASDMQLSFM